MVTAVESNMVGNLLRRLHLHPMDAAFNDLDSRRNTTLSHLRNFLPSWSKSTTNVSSYNRTPPHDKLLFTAQCSRTEKAIQGHPQAVRRLGNSSSCPSEIKPSKPFRRTTRTKLRHTARVSSPPYPTAILVKLKRLSTSPDSSSRLTIVDSAPKSLPPTFSVMVGSGRRSCGTSSCYTSPPVLHSPTPLTVSRFSEHPAPPILSDSKNLSLNAHSQLYSSLPYLNPISPTLLSTNYQRTAPPTVVVDKIAASEPSGEAISNVRQQATRSNSPVVTETRKHNSSSMYRLRCGYATPRRKTPVSFHPHDAADPSVSLVDQTADTILGANIVPNLQQQPLASVKRRRSYDQLGDFSIHGTPELSCRLRERRTTDAAAASTLLPSSPHELPSVSTAVPPTSPTVVLSLGLVSRYELDYYWPDFEALTSAQTDLPYHQGDAATGGYYRSTEEGGETDSLAAGQPNCHVARDQCVIEVPSWRYTPLTQVADSISSKSLMNSRSKPLLFSKHNPSSADFPPVKPEHGISSHCQSSTTSVLRTLRGGVLRSPGVLEVEGQCLEGFKFEEREVDVEHSAQEEEEEDISDAAYAARHSRLEWEEVKRERRSRQRSMEEELKQRWEQRDRATWQKRQPGRVDPLTKYSPEDRMPTQLNHPFSQVRRFCVDDKRLPAVAFGCRVPLASLRSFKRRQ